MGFDVGRVPDLLDASLRHLSPESALRRAAGESRDDAGPGPAAAEEARGELPRDREGATESSGDAKPESPT